MILQALGDAAGSQCDLAGDEVFAAALGFVVEQNAIHGEHAVRLTVFLDDPEAVLLGYRIRAVRMERRRLSLRNLLNLTIELRGRCLIHLRLLGQAQNAHGLQNAEHAQRIHITGVFRHIKAHLYVALRRQIVNFIRLYQIDDSDQARRIGQIAVEQLNPVHYVIDAGCVGDRCTACDTVHFIVLVQQELGEIRTVLSCYTGN